MKEKFRIFSAITLTTIYCFAVGAVAYSPVNSDFNENNKGEHAKYAASVSSKLAYHTSQVENSVDTFFEFSTPTFKKTFDELWLIANSVAHLFEAEFIQYEKFSLGFLINYRKTDIIFPFHYFW
ncbi:hypothetical protein [Chondrinema litorale]|uniref:hypothetical protein n=1 Tax=Chondrinema litorale TaxID=2994555 RepID=UPI00254295DD|nr:hypothetical protein [Chondrinema litorale]UZR97105.1 hypothetical protein OQ292_23690 [Chondrinema litorale]